MDSLSSLETLAIGARYTGLLPDGAATITGLVPRGANAVELFFVDENGRTDSQLLLRGDEARLQLVEGVTARRFEGDGALFRLVCEAQRLRLAHLFEPHGAIYASRVEPLPHQITAVYGDLLARSPLRFLLADDPGAGKTVMTGLYLKELAMRGELNRALIVCPGGLAEQWQDELSEKFGLDFEILGRDALANSGNPFLKKERLIARLDGLSRGEQWQELLAESEFDVIVVDEAHKMSASFFGGEMKATKRYRLGQLLSRVCRHFLLLSATPHNGKEEDFQFFMALLDPDRFEGRFRDGVHQNEVSDLMRRRVKEELLRFDGTSLFPQRRAYTVNYELSTREADLYEAVTDYVRDEMNRADKLDGRSGATVGFALTILQRRLASSPAAIYQSLTRRRKRLQERHALLKNMAHGAPENPPDFDFALENPDEFYEETASDEVEATEEVLVSLAFAARTRREMETELRALEKLERLALEVKNGGTDRKWDELSSLLHDTASEFFDGDGTRRKLIIFTEHRDTLEYLAGKIRTLLGREEAVSCIHGGVSRDERRRVQESFSHDKGVLVLLATDAAGEGINLQRAHLMVNYDLPWNPNRIEQRFGRIHRIGQREVCHLWNLVASQTREGQVWATLLEKLEIQRTSLGAGVFDVLGQCFDGAPLRQLLIEAVRYGEAPETRAKLQQKIEGALDTAALQKLLEERALAADSLSAVQIGAVRADMERASARRLQPHYIAQFFGEAFSKLGGELRKRETNRFEIARVPAFIREKSGRGRHAVAARYERVTFESEAIQIIGKPDAALLCPGHPLLETTIDLVLERFGTVLRAGAILVDDANHFTEPRALVLVENSAQDGARDLVSRALNWISIAPDSTASDAGIAPYLDFRAPDEAEKEALELILENELWPSDLELETTALDFAASHLVPVQLESVRTKRLARLDKTRAAVTERLTKEIAYWDGRSLELAEQEAIGKPNARLHSAQARTRADDLEARLRSRLQLLESQRHLMSRPPLVLACALVVPAALLPKKSGDFEPFESDSTPKASPAPRKEEPPLDPELRKKLDWLAMQTVMQTERDFGHVPTEMEHNHPGYDIESVDGESGALRFLEVKGKLEEYGTVTVSRTQILTALNEPEAWHLVIVPIERTGEGDDEVLTPREPFYLQRPFTTEPDFAATSVNFDLQSLLGGNGEGSQFL